MNSKLYAKLEHHIDEWVDNNCDSADWPLVVVGDRTIELMARAAQAVFDACEESQAYAVREGYLKDAL
jgi:hypothetical protein